MPKGPLSYFPVLSEQRQSPSVVPATLIFVGTHRVAACITNFHVPVENSWGRICSRLLSQREHSSTTSSQHSLDLDLGASTSTAGEQTLPPTGL